MLLSRSMKQSKKFITGILFSGLTLGMIPNANAGWFAFREGVLTHEQQESLQDTFMSKLASACWVLAEDEKKKKKGSLGADIISTTKQRAKEGVEVLKPIVGQLLYPYLICEGRRQIDHDAALAVVDPVSTVFKDINAACLLALRTEGDGLVNEVIRQTIQGLVTWTREQKEEAFNILWDSVVAQNNLTLEGVPAMDQTSKLWQYIVAFVQVNGKNLCEKFANYLANFLAEQIEESQTSCCLTCFQNCLAGTKELLAQTPDILKLILQIIQATKNPA